MSVKSGKDKERKNERSFFVQASINLALQMVNTAPPSLQGPDNTISETRVNKKRKRNPWGDEDDEDEDEDDIKIYIPV